MLCSGSVIGLQIVFSTSLYESTAKWETQIFKEDRLLVHICNQNSYFSTCIQSSSFYDDTHKSWEDIHQLRVIVVKYKN